MMTETGINDKGIVPVKTKMSIAEKLGFVRAMYVRHYYLWKRFRISAVVGLIASFVAILTFFFLNSVVQTENEYFMDYGLDYFTFALVGITFFAYANACLSLFRSVISETYFNNWLEIILSSPIRFRNYFTAVTVRSLISTTINILLYLIIGVFVLGAVLSINSNAHLIFLVLGLAILSISGLGLISASMFFLYDVKGGAEPVNWFFATFAGLVSGTLFPPSMFLDIFPPLYWFSRILPHTYALDALRRLVNPAFDSAADMPAIWDNIVILAMFSVALITLGAWMFKKGMEKAEREGALAKWGA